MRFQQVFYFCFFGSLAFITGSFFSFSSFATTYAKESRESAVVPIGISTGDAARSVAPSASAETCEVLGKFTGVSQQSSKFTHLGKNYDQARVFWSFDILEVRSTNASLCPSGASFDLRIRGAEFDRAEKRYIYAADVVQPSVGERLNLHIVHVQARDSLLKKNYSEWIYSGNLSDLKSEDASN